ncbi:FtsQ-type POTRA domain-containing protein [Pleurocapsales cyanobacterium LEGE 06147]|nr:FtsQ-type POTRA domain-containing protein [Pleurocapsales cyanobacterium LEGE 06147]
MIHITSPELKRKLSRLKRQNREERQRSLWRAFFVSAIAGSLILVAALPKWQIKDREQIHLKDARLVTEDSVLSSLALSYPQSIWTISSQQLSQKLESLPAIANAKVTRQILPPSLIVFLNERVPVAIAFSDGNIGFLDAEGTWIPGSFYQLDSDFPMPTLKVTNWQSEYRSYWVQIYRLLTQYSTVKIFELRWEEPTNLILKTEIGTVYFGSPTERLKDKFIVLARLKNLPNYLKNSEIAYIDLRNPDLRIIEKYTK